MTRTIAHRELRNNSSAVLRDVEAGEVIEVTNNGQVVAVLIPPHRPGSTLHYSPATFAGRLTDLLLATIDEPSSDAFDDLKGDR